MGIESKTLHVHSKTTETILKSDILNIKSFLVRKALLEHQIVQIVTVIVIQFVRNL
jgi:hypothetical protein